MPAEQIPGYVYVLTNKAFREDWVKIGKNSRPVDVRSKQLDNTAVPLPFDIYATLKTVKYNEVEKLVHKTIDRLTDLRIRQNREFFNVAPAVAFDILRDIASALEDAELSVYRGDVPVVVYPEPEVPAAVLEPVPTAEDFEPMIDVDDPVGGRSRRARFRFSMVGIGFGDELVFTPTGATVKVVSDNQVEYEGRIYKLSPFAGTFMPQDKRNTSGAYQGAKYFTFHGEVLDDLRKRMEEGTE